MCIDFSVGVWQREEIKQWRGLQERCFGYNADTNKQLPNILLEGASRSLTCLFFNFDTAVLVLRPLSTRLGPHE